MRTLVKDFSYSGRRLVRSRAFFLPALLTLALGIAASLTIFSLARSVVHAPLPYADPDRLFAIWEANLAEGKNHERVAPPNFHDYRETKGVFADAAAWWRFGVNLTDFSREAHRANAVECTANLFSVLGVRPQLGPGFAQGEGDQIYDPDPQAIVSHGLWRDRYAADPALIGKQITLNGNPYTVVGVMAPDFHFPSADVEIWQRQSWDFSDRSRYAHFMEAVGRLRPRVAFSQAQSDLAAVNGQLAEAYPRSNAGWQARLVPLHTEIVGDYGPTLSLLLAAISLLLLLACVNVANLLLVRAKAREPEMGIRAALGAGPFRLLRLAFAEALMLGMAAAALGTGMAFVAIKILVATKPLPIPRLGSVSFDAQVLGYSLALSLVTVLLFGTLPMLRLRSPDLRRILHTVDRTTGGRLTPGARSALVILEVALAMTLLVGAALLIRSGTQLQEEELGFMPENALTMTLELPASIYSDWSEVRQLYRELLERLRDHPAITQVGGSSFLPLSPAWIVGYTLPDRPTESEADTRSQYVTATPGYFETLRTPLLAGRFFALSDTGDSPSVVLINERMSRHIAPQPTLALGKIIHTGTRGFGPLGRAVKEDRLYEVIGVVGDIKNNGLENPPDPALFFVDAQFPYRTLNLVLRGHGAAETLVTIVREEVRRLDPRLPLAKVRTLDSLLAEATARVRVLRRLMSGFAGLATLLAAIGLFGALSYVVARRRYELAICLSLGALPTRLGWKILREGMGLVLVGLLLGGGLALWLGRFMGSLLFGVSTVDPAAFTGAASLLAAVALLACYLPARRATQVDPAETFRSGTP
jgi:predicted permease